MKDLTRNDFNSDREYKKAKRNANKNSREFRKNRSGKRTMWQES